MTGWRTNLMREYVPSPAQRRQYYLGMIVFLAGCGLALVVIVHLATLRLVDTVHERNKIAQMEAKFRSLHGDLSGSLDQVVGRLETELKQAQGRLASVQRLVSRQVRLDRLLGGLCQPLPRDVQLVRLDVRPGERVARFDLAMPDLPEQEQGRARALLEAYAAQPLLETELRDIRVVARQTQRVGDRAVAILRFEGRLVGGEE